MTRKVVVGYSADPAGHAALRMAAEEATLRSATLQIVHELVGIEAPYRYGRDSDFIAAQRAAAPAIRAALAEVAPALSNYELTLVTSPAADELVLASRSAELVVLGVTTNDPTAAAAFDTIPHEVVTRVTCPAMLVPAHVEHSPVQLVCGVDGSGGSASAFSWAASDAARRGVTLLAVDVVPPRPTFVTEPQALSDWVRRQHLTAETTVLCTREHSRHPARTLLEIAERRQALLVVGAHGSDGHHWGRSVARQVSAQTKVPVVVVPQTATDPLSTALTTGAVLEAH